MVSLRYPINNTLIFQLLGNFFRQPVCSLVFNFKFVNNVHSFILFCYCNFVLTVIVKCMDLNWAFFFCALPYLPQLTQELNTRGRVSEHQPMGKQFWLFHFLTWSSILIHTVPVSKVVLLPGMWDIGPRQIFFVSFKHVIKEKL